MLNVSARSAALAVVFAFAPFLASAQVGPNDIAVGKSAFQSSNYSGGHFADAAVDGNTNGNYGNNTSTHTNYDYRGWWYVDLGGDYSISSITLWNRTDCCGERLSDFFLSVLGGETVTPEPYGAATVWSQYTEGAVGENATFTPATGTVGRYVKVQYRDHANYLQLAEVDVEGGAAVVTPEPSSIALLATGLVGGLVARRRRKA